VSFLSVALTGRWKDEPSGRIHYPSGMIEDRFYTVTEAAKVLSITNRRVRQLAQEGRIDGQRTDGGWKLFRSSVHSFRDEKRSLTSSSAVPHWPPEARETLQRVNSLERELGRFEGRLELEAVTRSTLEAQLKREQVRADQERVERIQAQEETHKLRAELEAARKSWFRRFFGV